MPDEKALKICLKSLQKTLSTLQERLEHAREFGGIREDVDTLIQEIDTFRTCSEPFWPVNKPRVFNALNDLMLELRALSDFCQKIRNMGGSVDKKREAQEYLLVCQKLSQKLAEQLGPKQRLAMPRRKARKSAASILKSKVAAGEFDVFLAHNSQDKPLVEAISQKLKQRGLYPWLDKEQIAPGKWFQDVIQQAIPRVKSAAIFIGSQGLGKWQAVELRTFISQCVEAGLPVIPVLLPGVVDIPKDLFFLKELSWVQFKQQIDEVEALNQLEWGITDKRP